jgi:hypothetical protein
VASPTPRPLYHRERDPVPIVQEAGWAPGPVWTAAENLAATGMRSPDRPARSESLYRLRYLGPPSFMYVCKITEAVLPVKNLTPLTFVRTRESV